MNKNVKIMNIIEIVDQNVNKHVKHIRIHLHTVIDIIVNVAVSVIMVLFVICPKMEPVHQSTNVVCMILF